MCQRVPHVRSVIAAGAAVRLWLPGILLLFASARAVTALGENVVSAGLPNGLRDGAAQSDHLSPSTEVDIARSKRSDDGPAISEAQTPSHETDQRNSATGGPNSQAADGISPGDQREQLSTDGGADAKLQEVAAGLRKWKSTFQSILMVTTGFDRALLTQQEPAFPVDAVLDGTQWGYRSTFWYQDPFAMYFCHDLSIHGQTRYRSCGMADGFRYWIASSEDGQPDVFPHVRDEPLLRMATPLLHVVRDHPLEDSCRMAALRGLWWSPGCQWLSEKLEDVPGIHFAGMRDVDGHSCIVLSNRQPRAGGSSVGNHQTWYFDPQKQYLPRRFIISETNVTGESVDIIQTWEASEFQQAANGTWFPHEGFVRRNIRVSQSDRRKSSSVFEWKVLQLEVDQDRPAEMLQPPPITERTLSVNDEYLADVEFPIDDTSAMGMRRSETTAQLQERLRNARNRQLGKDSLVLLLLILVVGAVVMSLYAGYRRLSGQDLRSSV